MTTPASPLRSGAPTGPIETRWERHRFDDEAGQPGQPAQVRGASSSAPGLAGAAAAASLGRAGLPRAVVLLSRTARGARTASPPRAASTPPRTTRTTATACSACSTTPSRAATSARARRTSTAWPRSACTIIDQCVAQGVPFAREYGGLLANRSFGGAQVSRTFYARGQTGQQLLLGAYQALLAADRRGQVKMHPRTEMLDLVVVDGRARGIVTRDLVTGKIEAWTARRGGAGHRRLRQRLLPVDERQGLQRHGDLARLQARGAVREPLLHADPPDLHPGHAATTSPS